MEKNIISQVNDLSFKDIEEMPQGREKAIAEACAGLVVDGAHHKQYALEKVLEALGVDMDYLREHFYWDEGIPG